LVSTFHILLLEFFSPVNFWS